MADDFYTSVAGVVGADISKTVPDCGSHFRCESGLAADPDMSGPLCTIYPPREAVQTFAEPGDEFRMELDRSATLLMLLTAVVIGGLLLWLISRNFYRATLLRLKQASL